MGTIRKFYLNVVFIVLIPVYLLAQNSSPKLDALGDFKFREGELISISLSAFDLDGDSLTFSVSNLPTGAVFDNSGVLFWTPGYDQYGTYPGIHFEVSDGHGGLDFEDVTITILNWPPGDVTKDGKDNLSDVIFLVNYIFKGGPMPVPLFAGDVNLDNLINLADIIYNVNFIFKGGPLPKPKPEIKINYPVKGAVLNDKVSVNVENICGKISPGHIDLFYSTDSLNYFLLSYDTTDNAIADFFDTSDVNGLWNTETFSSGTYYLKAVYSGFPGPTSDEVKVRINKKPHPVAIITYDYIQNKVILDGTASSDPENDSLIRYIWHFDCDSTDLEGAKVAKSFIGPDTCQVILEVWDQVQNVGSAVGKLFYNVP